MAVRPKPYVLTGTSVDIINAIRNGASVDYRNYVPYATPDAESVKAIGAIIMDNVSLRNEFVNALVNRIVRVDVTSKLYENPIQVFKEGILEFGEVVEEIFVELAKVYEFDPEKAESEVFKRELPNVRSAFHIMNYQKFYKVTISQAQLRQAFLSWEGVTDLIAKITEQIYTAANYDEFLVMKYLIARRILNGQIAVETYDATATRPMHELAEKLKTVSNELEFMSPNYNIAGVRNYALKSEQYLLISAKADASMDINVLASAFNMDKAEFLGHRVMIDGFGKLDLERLDEIFAEDSTYTTPSSEEIEALNSIPAIIIDKDWFKVYDNLLEFDENFNGQGLYWNYFYHVWKTVSTSPFANAIMFLSAEPTITSVTVHTEHNAYTILPDGDRKTWQLNAIVEADGIGANKGVIWSVDEATIPAGLEVSISSTGNLTVFRPEKHGSWSGIKAIATSVADSSVYGEWTTS